MSKFGLKKSYSKKSSTEVRKSNDDKWWHSDMSQDAVEGMLSAVPTLESRFSSLPKGAGALKIFKKSVGVRMRDVTTMSSPDENHKICLSLSDECYDFLSQMESILGESLVSQLKAANPNYQEAEFKSCLKVSESTGKKYLKTKIKTLGVSRTIGVDEKGRNVTNAPESLRVSGTKICVRVRIDGVYAGTKNCGLVTSVDMFKVLSVPDEKEIEDAKLKRKEDMESRRMEELMEEDF